MSSQTICITGAESACGRAVAERMAADGWSMQAAEGAAIPGELPTLDALVCCHAEAGKLDWLAATADEWRELRRRNLDATFSCIQHAANAIVAEGREGAIVVVAPSLADAEDPDSVLSAATAWGVRGLVRNAAAAYARKGVRVNAVCAGGAPAADVAELVAFLIEEGTHVTGQTIPVADGRALL